MKADSRTGLPVGVEAFAEQPAEIDPLRLALPNESLGVGRLARALDEIPDVLGVQRRVVQMKLELRVAGTREPGDLDAGIDARDRMAHFVAEEGSQLTEPGDIAVVVLMLACQRL